MSGPLKELKILDVGMLVQGPQAAALLADMGASVLKIELPGMGDQSRSLVIGMDDFRSAFFSACNRGKKSVTLDLRQKEGRTLFKRLAEDADIVISNFKPGTMERWNLGYEDLKETNPAIIWAAGSAFGPVGPDASREGADLTGQAAGGLISTIGADDAPPSPVGSVIADHIASQNLAAGVLAALYWRSVSGRGQKVEVSLLGGQIWAQATEFTHQLMSEKSPGRSNYGHPLVHGIYGIFETTSGWLGIIGVPPDMKDVFFEAIERPDLCTDPRFEQPFISEEDIAWLKNEIAKELRSNSMAYWSDRMEGAGIRYAPVRSYDEVIADPGLWENGYFQNVCDDDGNTHRVVGAPIRMSDTPLEPGAVAPQLGQHTTEILTGLGISPAEMTVLRKTKVI